MRTTLTLDDDVAVRLERTRQGRGLSLKEAVNQLLRAGLDQADEAPAVRDAYRIRPVHTGEPGADLVRVSELLALEDEGRWVTARP